MAFADLMVGAVSLPLYIYFGIEANYQLWRSRLHTVLLSYVFLAASLIPAALISGERFYAIYWPLKLLTLSMQAYRIVIFTVWTLATLSTTAFFLVFNLLTSMQLAVTT